MTSINRIPKITSNSKFALWRWFSKMDSMDLLFHPDDDPAVIVKIHTGMPTFSHEECVTVTHCLKLLFDQHGDAVYEAAIRYAHKRIPQRKTISA